MGNSNRLKSGCSKLSRNSTALARRADLIASDSVVSHEHVPRRVPQAQEAEDRFQLLIQVLLERPVKQLNHTMILRPVFFQAMQAQVQSDSNSSVPREQGHQSPHV